MPRMVAPPPSGEFQIVLSKPFTGEYYHDHDEGQKEVQDKKNDLLTTQSRRPNTYD